MPHLWIPQSAAWQPFHLAHDRHQYWLSPTPPYLRRVLTIPPRATPVLAPTRDANGQEHWLLFLPAESTLIVNCSPLRLGVHVLRDRDELRFPTGPRLYFSSEVLPRPVPFPPSQTEGPCARCQRLIEPNSPAVRCSTCHAWCHQSPTQPCWFGPDATTCPVCHRSSDPDAFLWRPP